mmetsp:Transcript_55130/g.118362  ORF Transcript_55130/g.118362 Transcript_55130/m.118362 type:complete len:218 (-) Transcript_55130:2306-2959(-)
MRVQLGKQRLKVADVADLPTSVTELAKRELAVPIQIQTMLPCGRNSAVLLQQQRLHGGPITRPLVLPFVLLLRTLQLPSDIDILAPHLVRDDGGVEVAHGDPSATRLVQVVLEQLIGVAIVAHALSEVHKVALLDPPVALLIELLPSSLLVPELLDKKLMEAGHSLVGSTVEFLQADEAAAVRIQFVPQLLEVAVKADLPHSKAELAEGKAAVAVEV